MRQLKITKQITNRETQSFSKYLTEVNSIGDVISPEEEIELTRRIKEGDEKALEKLVTANLRFVISVAKQYGNMAPLPDLVNEGNLGLIKAANRFDETRGFKFISYAVWWIRQSIMQYLSDHGKMIRLPSNRVNMIQNVRKADNYLEQLLQRKPTYLEISELLSEKDTKYTEKMVKSLMKNDQKVSSVDAPITTSDESGSMLDLMEGDGGQDADKVTNKSDLMIEVERTLDLLPARQKEVLVMYFGLLGTRQCSLEEIGIKYDLTRERVRQIKEKALRRIKVISRNSSLKEFIQ